VRNCAALRRWRNGRGDHPSDASEGSPSSALRNPAQDVEEGEAAELVARRGARRSSPQLVAARSSSSSALSAVEQASSTLWRARLLLSRGLVLARGGSPQAAKLQRMGHPLAVLQVRG
jgi:hypothetical protein